MTLRGRSLRERFIQKKDSVLVPYSEEKISHAIFRAGLAAGEADMNTAKRIAREITVIFDAFYKGDEHPSTDKVKDLIHGLLEENGLSKTATAWRHYLRQHKNLAEPNSFLTESIRMIEDYISKRDWRVNENANMGFSLQGLNNHISSIISAHYWLNKVYTQDIAEAHQSGDFHIHDMGFLGVYCCGWDLLDLLTYGFGGAYGKIESKPPKHFKVALGQIVNFFYTMQGEAAGAQAFSNFDTYLAPFVRFDGLTYQDVRQAIQEFLFNINVSTRVGFQTPFTNITMDLVPPSNMKDQPVIIGGQPRQETYGDFAEEMAMINKAFCEVMMEGDSRGRIFSFPIPTYNLTKDFDWNDPKMNPLWEMTAKYGIPYFSNYINSDMNPEDARSMCCRLRLDNRELRRRGGGLFGSNPLTGSIGVVTMNMPRLGHISMDQDDFIKRLDMLMDTAKKSLSMKRRILEEFTDMGLYPYSSHYLRSVRERFGSYWNNHFSTIGLVGMNEACINLLGEGIGEPQGHAFAQRVLLHMRERMQQYQEETGNFFNLEATPAEGTAYRLAVLDRKLYPKITQAGDKEPYYTNSTHLPVGFTDDVFEVLKLQDPLQTLYTGGTVLHGFIGERLDSGDTCRKLVRKIAENFHLPYFTITPTFTICPVHGYIRGEHFQCPYHENEKRDPMEA
ncbi:MAG: ribonucleoside triphosphate reductase [Candidatus Wallbacteria bacterium HGW-Wallbacteria-1]|jgi:ribonucleoside-triphosphate reductase|uniref:Ribonucleoside triphosphate reductase n=1 Tax=Candidatus Wallbacteria bacterium HGW-Wallbacteria-1 TaxID=2013854 RepID=A0A2N1PVA9_9BACT|nr:MAG: ribonucleoside triphosphate reductase [Candidatus Wallbacteria bacterium HGW-Wallbacteria-1]